MTQLEEKQLEVQRYYQTELVLLYDTVAQDTSSPFVVVADSLLLDVLAQPLIDWKYGGQFLHFFHVLENLIHKMTRRG